VAASSGPGSTCPKLGSNGGAFHEFKKRPSQEAVTAPAKKAEFFVTAPPPIKKRVDLNEAIKNVIPASALPPLNNTT
jgi:hypothetical protein